MITAGITNNNQGKFLKSAIDSILSQSIEISRIIIVDDFSTDNSLSVVDRYLKEQNPTVKIHVITNDKPMGLAVSRNKIIADCTTKYLCFLESDNFYYKDKVRKSVEMLDRYPEMGVIYSDFTVWDLQTGAEQSGFSFAYDTRLLAQTNIINSNCVVKKEVFERIGLFDPQFQYVSDYALWLKASANFMMMNLPEQLFCMRMYPDKWIIKNQQQIGAEAQKLMQSGGK